eukprot:gene4743-5366_t
MNSVSSKQVDIYGKEAMNDKGHLCGGDDVNEASQKSCTNAGNDENQMKDVFRRIATSTVCGERLNERHDKQLQVANKQTKTDKNGAKTEENCTKTDGNSTKTDGNRASWQEGHRVLHRTSSYDIRKRTSDNLSKRFSLDEGFFRTEVDLSSYTAKEREILSMIIKKDEKLSTNNNSLDDGMQETKCVQKHKPNFLHPKKFIQELKQGKAQRNSTHKSSVNPPDSTTSLSSEKQDKTQTSSPSSLVRKNNHGKSSENNKLMSVFKRIINSVQERIPAYHHPRVVVNSREHPEVSSPKIRHKKYSLVGTKKASDNDEYYLRRPSNNLELHAMLQDEYKRSPPPHRKACSAPTTTETASTLNIVEKVEQARMEYASEGGCRGFPLRQNSMPDCHKKTNKNLSINACFARANSARYSQSPASQTSTEMDGSFFEAFGKFKRDPFCK